MDKDKTAKEIIRSSGGIAKTSQFVSAGFSTFDVAKLRHDGHIERIRHGYYKLSEKEEIKEEQILAALLPEGIVCVESALFHYGYSDFTPRRWSVAVPRTFSRTRLKFDNLPMQIYYIQNDQFEIGKGESIFDGVKLNVYDRERTILNIVPSSIMSCLTRRLMPMLQMIRRI